MPSLVSQIQDRLRMRHDPQLQERVLEEAARYIEWAKQDYHQKFLAWLQEQGDAPVKITGSHADLIAGTARANTFKEIRHYLLDQEGKASAALDREQHG